MSGRCATLPSLVGGT
eukprot:gene9748-biopygen8616